jgi:hypothetical protein
MEEWAGALWVGVCVCVCAELFCLVTPLADWALWDWNRGGWRSAESRNWVAGIMHGVTTQKLCDVWKAVWYHLQESCDWVTYDAARSVVRTGTLKMLNCTGPHVSIGYPLQGSLLFLLLFYNAVSGVQVYFVHVLRFTFRAIATEMYPLRISTRNVPAPVIPLAVSRYPVTHPPNLCCRGLPFL